MRSVTGCQSSSDNICACDIPNEDVSDATSEKESKLNGSQGKAKEDRKNSKLRQKPIVSRTDSGRSSKTNNSNEQSKIDKLFPKGKTEAEPGFKSSGDQNVNQVTASENISLEKEWMNTVLYGLPNFATSFTT